MKVFYSPDYVGAAHAFDTTRKAKWVADSLGLSPIDGVELVAPEPLSWDHLVRLHDPTYVEAVKTGIPSSLAESQGFPWDPGLWRMVLATNGGMVAAALTALEDGVAGSLSSGLHHARRESGAGFCTFNGLALAAHRALSAVAGSVLVLDLDAHCGGGTASLIAAEPRLRQIDVAVCGYDNYERSRRAQLRIVEDSREYLDVVEDVFSEVERQGERFDLCLYNAGMDPFEGCSLGGLAGMTSEILAAREQRVFDWCRGQSIPIAFALSGGYVGEALDREHLVALHRLTVSEAARCARDG